MKIYTISYDWIENGETGNRQCEVIGAYSTLESARKHFDKFVKGAKEGELDIYYDENGNIRDGYIEEQDEWSFDVYEEYAYNMTHTAIYIEEVELKN